MAAWDATPQPNAPSPASYAAPLLNFAPLAEIPGAYFQGAEQRRAYDAARAFPNGLPKTPDGRLDVNGIVDTSARLGGVQGVQGLLPFLIQQESGQQNQSAITGAGQFVNGGTQGGAQPPQVTTPAPATPTPRPMISPTGIPTAAPNATTAPSGDGGANSVVGLADKYGLPTDSAATGTLIGNVAQAAGVDPNDPITDPAKLARVDKLISSYAQRNGIRSPLPAPPPTNVAGTGAAPTPQGGVQPAVADAPITPTPVPTTTIAPDNAGGTTANLPPGFDEATATRLDQAANYLRGMAASRGKFDPEGAKGLLSQADAYTARSKDIRDTIAKTALPTDVQKNYLSDRKPGESLADYQARVKGGEAYAADEATRFGKRYEAINKAGMESSVELPQLQLAKAVMSDPNFYSGPAEGLNLAYKRLLSTIDPSQANTAEPQEAFRKVISNSILSQVRSLAGTGQVRVAEIRIMEKAAANQENTPAANRLLVEIASRLHQHNVDLATLAQNYNGGRLDPQFDAKVQQWTKDHPLFTGAELKDPRLIAPPIYKDPAALQAAKLPPNTPFQTPDGRTKYTPPAPQ